MKVVLSCVYLCKYKLYAMIASRKLLDCGAEFDSVMTPTSLHMVINRPLSKTGMIYSIYLSTLNADPARGRLRSVYLADWLSYSQKLCSKLCT